MQHSKNPSFETTRLTNNELLTPHNQALLEKFIAENSDDKVNNDLLECCVKENRLESIIKFVNLKVNLNITNKAGMSLLHIAAQQRNIEMMDILIQGGANIQYRDERGYNALGIALSSCPLLSEASKISVVSFLIGHGINLPAVNLKVFEAQRVASLVAKNVIDLFELDLEVSEARRIASLVAYNVINLLEIDSKVFEDPNIASLVAKNVINLLAVNLEAFEARRIASLVAKDVINLLAVNVNVREAQQKTFKTFNRCLREAEAVNAEAQSIALYIKNDGDRIQNFSALKK